MEFNNGGPAAHIKSAAAHKPVQHKKKSTKKVVVVSVIAVLVVALALVSTLAVLGKTGAVGANAAINKDEYQAVFLTNGQVYFGKLHNAQGDYLTLTDIYYLQVDSSIQAGATEEEIAAQTASDSNVQLIKLGNELHGPQDEMQISSQQVLFWENLKSESKVSQAIDDYDGEAAN